MYGYVSANVVSLIYLIILSSVYFLKRKYNFLESRIYKSLIIFTILTLALDIINVYCVGVGIPYANFLFKLYFVALLVWLSLFVFYIMLNMTDEKYDNFKIMLKQSVLSKCVLSFYGIMLLFLLFSGVNYDIDASAYTGIGVKLMYLLGIGTSLFLLLFVLLNNSPYFTL